MDAGQLREYVVRPALRHLDPHIPYTEDAVELLMGTAAQESSLLYLDQLTPGPGPAYGLWQMERATHDDHWRWLRGQSAIHARVTMLLATSPSTVEQLRTNLLYAAAMCRVHYRRAPEAIPVAADVENAARLWKLRYNTPAGRGTVAQYVASYRRACG